MQQQQQHENEKYSWMETYNANETALQDRIRSLEESELSLKLKLQKTVEMVQSSQLMQRKIISSEIILEESISSGHRDEMREKIVILEGQLERIKTEYIEEKEKHLSTTELVEKTRSRMDEFKRDLLASENVGNRAREEAQEHLKNYMNLKQSVEAKNNEMRKKFGMIQDRMGRLNGVCVDSMNMASMMDSAVWDLKNNRINESHQADKRYYFYFFRYFFLIFYGLGTENFHP